MGVKSGSTELASAVGASPWGVLGGAYASPENNYLEHTVVEFKCSIVYV